MYKLKKPSNRVLVDHYNKYGPRIQYLMRQMATCLVTVPFKLGTTKPVHLALQVQQGSATWQFLTKYAQEPNLRRLLCGDWQDHLNIIREVSLLFPGLTWQNKMLKGVYDLHGYQIYGQDSSGHEIVEDFNEILYWLFVIQMYGGKDAVAPFNKREFVEERNLEVCPYCGRQMVDMAEEDGNVSKPYIDHFLPKRKYPFLAMSYQNMIQACNTCNEDANKGDMDPLEHPNFGQKLLNPHEFYDHAVRFGYHYNHKGENEERNFKVIADAETALLEEGYLKTLKLRKFYARQTLQVKDIYRGFTTATNSMRKFLYRIGLNRSFLQDIEQRTLGYQLNDDEAQRRQWYKFRKDVFMQLRREHGI